MIWPLYDIGITVFGLGTKLAALWNPRIRKWNINRKWTWTEAQSPGPGQKSIWVHCASLGEYDQARPLITALRSHDPEAFITLSFFSPSGFESKKNAEHVDQVIYLPLDKKRDMELLSTRLKPQLFVGVKYEFWHRLIQVLDRHNVTMIWISVKFRVSHFLDRSWAKALRKNLERIDYWFCQDEATHLRLEQWGITSTLVTGDTRLESILQKRGSLPVPKFRSGQSVFVYASVYLVEMSLILAAIEAFPDAVHIVVPHQVDPAHITQWKKLLPQKTKIWEDQISEGATEIYLVNTIGKLFGIYSMATAVYVGGGFGKSVHNTLEPASCFLPIAIGPRYEGFLETEILTADGTIAVVRNEQEIQTFFSNSRDEHIREQIKKSLVTYFEHSKGATQKIMQKLTEKGFLK